MLAQVRIAAPPTKPVVIFDGDCRFCTFWIRRFRRITGDGIEYLSFQAGEIASRFPGLDRQRLTESVHLVQPDGLVFYGAEAALRALALSDRAAWLLRLYSRSALLRDAAESIYSLVAGHREFFSFLTHLWWGKLVEPPTFVLTRSILIRAIGLIYLIALVSLWSQINGLIGARGILPAAQTIEAVRSNADARGLDLGRYHVFPTFCWFDATDRSLNWQCAAGVALAVLVFFGIAPAPCLFLLWLIYLSLSTISREFLGFQWDNLLLETGLLAIFLAPLWFLPWTTSRARPASTIILWLLRWLLFRLMFESGCVKLLSHDPTWSDLTALTFHYETQPLPTWIAWHTHHLPIWMHKVSCLLMFGIELVVPFFVFGPRRLKIVAGLIFIAFQVSIVLTGNYCFFNLLTILLCFALFDDHALRSFGSVLRKLVPRGATSGSGPPPVPIGSDEARLSQPQQATTVTERLNVSRPVSPADIAAAGTAALRGSNIETRAPCEPRGFKAFRIGTLAARFAVALLVLLLTVPELFHMFSSGSRPRSHSSALQEWFAPFRSFNGYGLFAVMTRPRYEIIVQGSNDGQTWLDYEFKYKPGDPRRRPGFIAPHQPRLDWQMWFAALGDYRSNPWFVQFCGRLLQDSPDVRALLKTNSFPSAPPHYVRALLYEYHFTDAATRRATGEWWRRELKGDYLPVLSLRTGSGHADSR